MLQRKKGTTLVEIMDKMGWQKHTVRGFMAGAMKKAGLRGLDLEAVLLRGRREKAPDAVRLPIRGLPDLGQGRARVAPLGRPISSRIFEPLLSARGVLADLVRAGLPVPTSC